MDKLDTSRLAADATLVRAGLRPAVLGWNGMSASSTALAEAAFGSAIAVNPEIAVVLEPARTARRQGAPV